MVMVKLEKRKIVITCVLSLLLTLMQIAGWQISVDYGSSVHQLAFFQNIGILETWQCLLWGILEWFLLSVFFYFLFTRLEKRGQTAATDCDAAETVPSVTIPRFFWPVSFLALFAIWMIFLWGCYPGYYNYDAGNQLPQVMYEEVPYNAHHPLLHTLICGGIITLGYRITGTDLTFGVFLYNFSQMIICAACLSYSLRYIYKCTCNRILTVLSFCFYALCPPVVMFAMSTTKDVICYSFLLAAVIRLLEIFKELEAGNRVKISNWLILGGLLTLSCLFRKNNIFALLIFAVFTLVFINRERKKQIWLYIGVIVVYFFIDKALLLGFNAIPGSVNEALCVPYQQIARLYTEKGKDAFTEEEYELLCEIVDPEALYCYDPVMADYTKATFNPGLETLKENVVDYFLLWLKKGFQYPQVYIESFLYNTYQAWYPGTIIMERIRDRYFDITGWQDEYAAPHWQGLYDFYESFHYSSYAKYPVIRLLFSNGSMFWLCVITWFYGIWKKDKHVIAVLLLVLLVCATIFCGPVMDVRYFLILFYLAPLCLGLLWVKPHKNTDSNRL